jgi:hypothetical protein
MQIVYNSEQFYVIAYPAEEGYEIIDKAAGRGAFFRGEVALRFRDSMRDIVAHDPSTDMIDEFISGFDVAMTQPAVYH